MTTTVALQLSDRVTPEAGLALPEVAALLVDAPRRPLLRFEGSGLCDRANHHRRWRANPAGKPRCAGAGVTEIRRRYGTAWKGCTW